MAYRSDIDLSTLHKANIDEEVSYKLSWHFSNKTNQQCTKTNFDNFRSRSCSSSNSNDINNNFYTKVSNLNAQFNSTSIHRGKSGTWP
jgi:hypothetical protein